MPQMKNARKALRQSFKRQAHNQSVRDNIKFLVKQTKKFATAKNSKAEASLTSAIKAIDKAVQKGIVKKNTGARRKSRLIKQMKQLMK